MNMEKNYTMTCLWVGEIKDENLKEVAKVMMWNSCPATYKDDEIIANAGLNMGLDGEPHRLYVIIDGIHYNYDLTSKRVSAKMGKEIVELIIKAVEEYKAEKKQVYDIYKNTVSGDYKIAKEGETPEYGYDRTTDFKEFELKEGESFLVLMNGITDTEIGNNIHNDYDIDFDCIDDEAASVMFDIAENMGEDVLYENSEDEDCLPSIVYLIRVAARKGELKYSTENAWTIKDYERFKRVNRSMKTTTK